MRPLERFERVSFETERLPLFCFGSHRGRESWGNAVVRWLSPGYGEAKAADQLGEEEEEEEEEEDGKRGSHVAGASGVGKRGKGGGGGLGDKNGKTDNQGTLASSAGAKGKGKLIVIDWWTYEPPKDGQ